MAFGSLLHNFYTLLGLSTPGGIWRLLAIIFALLNIKSLPFAWHLRLFNGYLTQLTFAKSRSHGSSALFQPLIISSRTPLLECDYNIHKSNSTYFTDLDISRTHLLLCLLKPGIDKVKATPKKDRPNARAGPMLGGVTCHFKREIKPYQAFEIWTRVLCWDRKWLYLVSHFVEKGRVKPKGYTLQPWKKGNQWSRNGDSNKDKDSLPHPAIFASSIAKYVFKEGRLTVPPETVLVHSNLLPPKPASHETPPATVSSSADGSSIELAAAVAAREIGPVDEQVIDAAVKPLSDFNIWTWETVEQERLRGMKLAGLFAGLDELHNEFTADKEPVLGQF